MDWSTATPYAGHRLATSLKGKVMVAPENRSESDEFAFSFPKVELKTPYLQHMWGELLDNLYRAEHEGADIEGDAYVAQGFVLGLAAAEVVTDEQRDLMYELLSLTRQEALRRVGRHKGLDNE
ncbi:hypothetical protein [Pseudomonas mercuritolerans]|uniref:Uncharacterized protein n=2 Tax=Pseudomonas TaxID=286 RepID=A0ABT2XWR0_9PSED|nr:hypothetical protein [Pseudomonas mercuritolerans]MCV2220604.1 hypothetical protein [Pseudomonas mercuritolerans]